jgi:hypothetical protein
MDAMFLLMSALPLVLYLFMLPEIRARKTQSITVSDEGVTFEDGPSARSASWQEIADLKPGGTERKPDQFLPVYMLNLPDGKISFTSRIDNFSALKQITEERCRQSSANQ